MGELQKLKNIGPKGEYWLNQAGFFTLADIEAAGAVEAWQQVRQIWPQASLVGLYALQGALMNLHWNALPESLKDELRAAWQAADAL
jgi:DNA transformation protein